MAAWHPEADADVVIAGTGPAGLCAAWMAWTAGAHVLLVGPPPKKHGLPSLEELPADTEETLLLSASRALRNWRVLARQVEEDFPVSILRFLSRQERFSWQEGYLLQVHTHESRVTGATIVERPTGLEPATLGRSSAAPA